ncbi:hypothetical protein [Williamsia sp. CHRR-6]|uniref:hypothetical protein n=1 Tax=Williamsia sp. CHRR-6 TaxID=2835871 RepID=UPI001BD9AB5C|nr:hypothetical protein [Williamsia sp. CHRR-6]MBT0566872.1 hypothetical protein [Williamsia sp. CHRR-6]
MSELTTTRAVSPAPDPCRSSRPRDVRVRDGEEAFVIAERVVGVQAPIQVVWVFDTDPGEESIRQWHTELGHGLLNRRAVAPRVPLARHRWVRAAPPAGPKLQAQTIADDDVQGWLADHLRHTPISPTHGHAWDVAAVLTTSGRRVVSLLASHMACDGRGLRAELQRAVSGECVNTLPDIEVTRGWAGLRADLRDAAGQIVAAATAVGTLVRVAAASRSRDQQKPAPRARRVRPCRREQDREISVVVVDIDRDHWTARARELQGTNNSLFAAVLAGVVRRAEEVPEDAELALCVVVDRRSADDDRANAAGGVWIRVRGPQTPERGLAEIRHAVKAQLIDYAESGRRDGAEELHALVRLVPGALMKRVVGSFPAPDTTLSNLGVITDDILTIGGVAASSHFIASASRGLSSQGRRRYARPYVTAFCNEYADRVTLVVCGLHPDFYGDRDQLQRWIDEEVRVWGLTATPW